MDDDKSIEQLILSKLVPPDPDRLDEELEKLLKEDKLLDDSFKGLDQLDFINDVSVFDSDVQGDAASSGEKEKHPQKSRVSIVEALRGFPKSFYIISGGLAALIVVVLAFGAIFALIVRGGSDPADGFVSRPEYAAEIEQPQNALNDSSFIFLSELSSFRNMPVQLSKMVIGQLSTIFFLRSPLDRDRYAFSLFDQDNLEIGLDLALAQPDDVLYFSPFGPRTKEFVLKVHDRASGEAESMAFELKNLKFSPARHLKEPIGIAKGALVCEASFSNTGSTVSFYFSSGDGAVQMGEAATVSLSSGGNYTFGRGQAGSSAKKYRREAQPAIHQFLSEGKSLARTDFEAVSNLDSAIEARVNGLFQAFSPDSALETLDLFNFSEKGPQTLNLGDYSLVLEGMQRQGSVIVLVLHSENNGGKRAETKIEAELEAYDLSGNPLAIPGKCYSGQEGSDVVFEIGEPSIISLSPENIKVKMNKILIKLPEIVVPITAQMLGDEQYEARARAKRQIEESFLTRLRYKSKLSSYDSISGFASELKAREDLAQLYAPEDLSEKASYFAQTSILHLEYRKLYAIVLESWSGASREISRSFSKTHNITAIEEDGRWIIQTDEMSPQ
ncbi:MAG: hypothetical protein LBU32_14060 [Clostridiales bacterium]|jgi:hypothetical protein|nr:hypothetical protein [Clostridiales bacterium]